MTYTREETLLKLVLDIYECESEVNQVSKQYLYQREGQVGEFLLKFQQNP